MDWFRAKLSDNHGAKTAKYTDVDCRVPATPISIRNVSAGQNGQNVKPFAMIQLHLVKSNIGNAEWKISQFGSVKLCVFGAQIMSHVLIV